MRYVALGITRDRVLELTRLTRHQYYYKPKKGRRAGRSPSKKTFQIIDGDVVSLGNDEKFVFLINNIKLSDN